MLDNQKHLFRLDGEYCFLNGAYMSPQLISVEEKGLEAIGKMSKPYQLSTDDFFEIVEDAKSNFAKIIHANSSDSIAFIPSASYGIATVANNINFSKGDEMVILKDQFPSNYYSWKRKADESSAIIKIVDGSEGSRRGKDWNENILNAINENTKLVAISHVHWAEGIIFDLKAIREKTNEHDAWLVIDGTQSVGAFDINVSEIKPDALICAAYKWLMGPYGTAMAYYGPRMQGGVPIEENWINRKDSHQFQNLVNYQGLYSPGQGRYSVGEQSNFILLPMLSAALQQLIDWGILNIQSYCKALNEPFLKKLENLGFSVLKEGQMSNHLLGIRMPKHIDEDSLKHAYKRHNIVVSFRGQSIRISPNVYNDANDWERLLEVTERMIK